MLFEYVANQYGNWSLCFRWPLLTLMSCTCSYSATMNILLGVLASIKSVCAGHWRLLYMTRKAHAPDENFNKLIWQSILSWCMFLILRRYNNLLAIRLHPTTSCHDQLHYLVCLRCFQERTRCSHYDVNALVVLFFDLASINCATNSAAGPSY